MAKKKYSHKQIVKDIKKDELRDLIGRTVDFTKSHTENILISIIIIGVIIVLIPLYFKHKADNEMRAATMYNQVVSMAMQPVSTGGQGQFKTVEEKYKQVGQQYSDIVANYRNTKTGMLARIGEANAAYYAQDYAKAASLFQELTEMKADLPLTVSLKERLGNCYEQQGKWQEALTVYKGIVDNHSGYYGMASVKLSMANCYKGLNKPEEAKAILEKQASNENDYWAGTAKRRLALMEQDMK